MRGMPMTVFLVVFMAASHVSAQSRVEKNVIYGMYSGLALLMDVHRAEKPNGYGVIFVSGSGWHAPLTYGAVGLKEGQIGEWGPPLLRAGYTVFAINHRAAPRFHYPAAVDDVQRAVRFIRHHARQFGINPSRLGAVAGSSGAHRNDKPANLQMEPTRPTVCAIISPLARGSFGTLARLRTMGALIERISRPR